MNYAKCIHDGRIDEVVSISYKGIVTTRLLTDMNYAVPGTIISVGRSHVIILPEDHPEVVAYLDKLAIKSLLQ